MKIKYLADGSPLPIYEAGDFVRFVRDEDGPIVTARAGDWGQVVRVTGTDVDVRLAGFCRPRTTDLPMARHVAQSCVAPCDRSGQPLRLSRDFAHAHIRRRV